MGDYFDNNNKVNNYCDYMVDAHFCLLQLDVFAP